jgi:molybdopterin/thiamine biosynthesis adenylyltransferase
MSDERYSRQQNLEVIGAEGQLRLGAATVLIVGCGALGSAQADLLARAGTGTLRLVDRDVLELSNLQRQQLYDEDDVREGLPKAAAAARRLRRINSAIRIEEHVADVTAHNIGALLDGVDLLVDGTDNFDTRYLLNDAAVKAGVPWIYGGVLGTEGTVLTVRPGVGPCLRCLFDDPPDASGLPTCETYGVLGAAVSWVAALQVTEALKLLCAAPGDETDRNEARSPEKTHNDTSTLYSLDIWAGALYPSRARRRPNCTCCGQRRFEFLDERRGAQSTSLCGRNAVQVSPDRPRAVPLDLERLADELTAHGELRDSGMLLELTLGEGEHVGKRLVIFPDGRVLVMGTTDTAEARTLVARYVGS